jgi:hypothetical protein
MWLRFLIALALGVVLALLLGMLAADGMLGRYGWTIALVVGSAVAGGFAGGFVPPRRSAHALRGTDQRPTPHS